MSAGALLTPASRMVCTCTSQLLIVCVGRFSILEQLLQQQLVPETHTCACGSDESDSSGMRNIVTVLIAIVLRNERFTV